MADRAEILRIELREKGITIAQVWIMCPEMRFENVTTITDRFEPLARAITTAIVASQIAQRLFTFEYRGRSNLFRDRPVTGHVGAISAPGQSYFHRARGKPVRLCPNKRELF